jgi:endoglucanase
VYNSRDEVVRGTITESLQGPSFKHYLVELASGSTMHHAVGDVGVWDLPRAEVKDGNFHTLACDDLAAVAAAFAAFDVLREIAAKGELKQDVRVLLTRAEEIGFIGAIAAVKHGTIPAEARVIALENSRAFAESPIGGGPIVRVGDRLSVFSPTLTDAIAARAEQVAGAPSTVTAAQKVSALPAWKWQRKLMAGGACEASVFFHSGLEATCVCLPLGNYHNMGDLAAVQAGTNTTRPMIEREFIGVSDYEGLVDLLVACGVHLPAAGGMGDRLERLWKQHAGVLG